MQIDADVQDGYVVEAQPADDTEQATRAAILTDLARFQHDPEGFVLYAFPWGQPGTILEKKAIRVWQGEFLRNLGRRLREGAPLNFAEVIQEATASGHGIGKSCLVAWLILWAMSTLEDCRGVVTANTDTQLRKKTWPEVGKWYHLMINRFMFKYTSTALYSTDPDHEKSWSFDLIPWSEENTEAFAGLHNEGKRILIVFDEASGIHNKIWEVTEGALTDENTEIIWCVFGNPTRRLVRFFQCFHGEHAGYWGRRHIDSRDVEGTNKKFLQQIVDTYGEDSDVARYRVRGLFPQASSAQFIESDIVSKAQKRHPGGYDRFDPLIMGVDIARGGADQCVIRYRRGQDAQSWPVIKIPGGEMRDSMKMVAKIADLISNPSRPDLRPDAIFIDETGVGGPLVDRLKQLGFKNVYGVVFSNSATGADGMIQAVTGRPKLANKRIEMWWFMREWLRAGGAIDKDSELEQGMTAPTFHSNAKDQTVLQSKEEMKADGLASPDDADALALTFAMPVMPRSLPREGLAAMQQGQQVGSNYDPYDSKRW